MWRLIRAELNYQRVILLPVGGCLAGLLIFLAAAPAALYLPELPFQKRVIISFWFLFYLAFVGGFNTAFSPFGIAGREKRNRLYALMPMSLKELGRMRVLALSAVWVGLVGIYGSGLWLSGDWAAFWAEPACPRSLLALTGAFSMGTAHMLIMADLRTLFLTGGTFMGVPLKRLFFALSVGGGVAYAVAVLVVILLNIPSAGPYEEIRTLAQFLLQSWTCAAIFLLVGAGMLSASIVSFRLRRSFLE
jgi:hypothetical protein